MEQTKLERAMPGMGGIMIEGKSYVAVTDVLTYIDELDDYNPHRKFKKGQRVRKIKGSSWQGKIVGYYATDLTPIGYAVESEREPGSVQIYPENALELVPEREYTYTNGVPDSVIDNECSDEFK